jgi:hypothetical protein
MDLRQGRSTSSPHLTKAACARQLRNSLRLHLHEESGTPALGTAIYTLSDPRDIRAARYVGQTGAPRRRLQQHLNAARLWLPDETPWWIRSALHRPLYDWIRALHRDGLRLPVMVVWQWVEGPAAAARLAELALIDRCLDGQCSLLNVECAAAGPQLPLL